MQTCNLHIALCAVCVLLSSVVRLSVTFVWQRTSASGVHAGENDCQNPNATIYSGSD